MTVLLEKVAGNSRIDKLHAICLLEVDFNWWLKVVFAKQMMHRMKSAGVLPLEQGENGIRFLPYETTLF